MIRTIAIIAAVAAVPAAAQMQRQMQRMSAPTFIAKAGASDLYEKQSSQLLLTSTNNEALKRYANMMIQHHTKSTNDVKMAATQAGLTVPPPRMEPMQRANMAALRRVNGVARDRLYVQQQRASHRMALQLHQSYSRNGTVQPLRAAATNIVPVVQQHLDEIQRM